MIQVVEIGHIGLILYGVSFQPRNPLFDCLPKPGTNFKTFIGNQVGDHACSSKLNSRGCE